jgi:S1-C subfamily serine protease
VKLALFLAGALLGGAAVGGAPLLLARAEAPAAEPTAVPTSTPTTAAESPVVAAVNAVLPAVVTVVNKGNNNVEIGSGSGVVIDKDLGYVVTNSHVIEQSRTTDPVRFVEVVLSDGTRRSAVVVGNDPGNDVAVLKVEGGFEAEAMLADSARVPLGAQVVAIGSPGIQVSRAARAAVLQNTVTLGIVSGLGRQLPRADLRNGGTLTDLVQTDAAINPGNSGGPLVWVATKQVVGLNTLVVRGSGEEGLGFAVSSARVKEIAQRLIARGSSR